MEEHLFLMIGGGIVERSNLAFRKEGSGDPRNLQGLLPKMLKINPHFSFTRNGVHRTCARVRHTKSGIKKTFMESRFPRLTVAECHLRGWDSGVTRKDQPQDSTPHHKVCCISIKSKTGRAVNLIGR